MEQSRAGTPTSPPPVVEGLTTGRLLGTGSSGEVWAAVEVGTGRAVALKVLHGQGRGEVSRRESALQRRLDHPHLLALLRTTRTTDGRTALVTELAAGGSLAALVRARGGLDPGEVVTVLTPLAGALADLHDRGVVHGDVSAGNVLFLADGRPVLADLGTAGLLGVDPATHATPGYADPAVARGAGLAPASDVHALGALAWFALTASVAEPAGQRPPLIPVAPGTPPALASLVERCLDPEPRRRPGAAEVAVQAFRAADAVPVRLVPTDPWAEAAEVVTHRLREEAARDAVPPVVRTPGRRRRPVVVAAVGALLVALAVATTTLGGSSGADADLAGSGRAKPTATTPPGPGAARDGSVVSPRPPAPASTTMLTPTFTPSTPPDPIAADDPLLALPALSTLRAQGFSSADADPLRQANVDGSPALEADLATLSELDRQEVRLDGLAFVLDDAELVSRNGDTATVRVTVVTGAHRVVGRDGGDVVEDVEASAPAPVRLLLLRVDGRWRVSEVL